MGLVREDIVLGLQQEGWIVLDAATGAGALKALQETNTVDLLITDIRLADPLTGWDIAEAFRASSPIGAVIYASGNSDNDGRRVAGSVFLSKPVTISSLLVACRKVLQETDDSFPLRLS
jgi:CheY-like chemotaxis protein